MTRTTPNKAETGGSLSSLRSEIQKRPLHPASESKLFHTKFIRPSDDNEAEEQQISTSFKAPAQAQEPPQSSNQMQGKGTGQVQQDAQKPSSQKQFDEDDRPRPTEDFMSKPRMTQ
jgi:hypothetical protein